MRPELHEALAELPLCSRGGIRVSATGAVLFAVAFLVHGCDRRAPLLFGPTCRVQVTQTDGMHGPEAIVYSSHDPTCPTSWAPMATTSDGWRDLERPRSTRVGLPSRWSGRVASATDVFLPSPIEAGLAACAAAFLLLWTFGRRLSRSRTASSEAASSGALLSAGAAAAMAATELALGALLIPYRSAENAWGKFHSSFGLSLADCTWMVVGVTALHLPAVLVSVSHRFTQRPPSWVRWWSGLVWAGAPAPMAVAIAFEAYASHTRPHDVGWLGWTFPLVFLWIPAGVALYVLATTISWLRHRKVRA